MNPRSPRLFIFGLLFLFIITALVFPLTGANPFQTNAGAQTGNPRAQNPARPLPNYDAFAGAGRRDGAGARSAISSNAGPRAGAGRPVQYEPRLGVPTFLWAPRQAAGNSMAARGPQQSAGGAVWAAREHLGGYASLYRLSDAEVAAAKVVGVHDTGRGAVIVKLKQEIGGVEVFRDEINVVMDRDLRLVALSGYLTGDEAGAGLSAQDFRLQPAEALSKAVEDLTGAALSPSAFRGRSPEAAAGQDANPYTLYTADGGAAQNFRFTDEPSRVKRVMFHLPDGYVPAYYVEAFVMVPSQDATTITLSGEPVMTELAYSYVISAVDGQLLFRNNLIDEDGEFTYRVWADPATKIPYDTPAGNGPHPKVVPLPDAAQAPFVPQTEVTLRNFPFSQNDPWLAPGATETVGNNVDAYADIVNPDGYGPVMATPADAATGDFRAKITGPGAFLHTHLPGTQTLTTAEARQASVQQLFYNVNFLHDWFYDAGFDEAAGNAQASNYGRGGVEGDSMRAEAQDVSARNNANMLTPADGARPRMQMFVFDTQALKYLDVLSPADAAGRRSIGTGTFGPQSFDLTNDIVASAPHHGCTAFTNAAAVAGKVVLVNFQSVVGEPTCSIGTKLNNAMSAGAAGFILVYLQSSPNTVVNVSGSLPSFTIPFTSLSWNGAAGIKTQLAAGQTVTARILRTPGTDRDGTVDNQIVFHEWGHYISNRLIGNANGLSTNHAGGLGEGWGDFTSMLLTVRPDDTATPSNENWQGAYAMATYVSSGTGNDGYYFGGRRAPYSTNFAINPLTFKHIQDGVALPGGVPYSSGADGANNSEVHNTGEVWTTMLWECYASLLRDTQGASPRLTFDEAQTRMKNYLVAGLKMTPPSPTFLEARDAILVAAFAYDYQDGLLFAQAFAKRGAGLNAVAPDRFSTNNVGVVESFEEGGALTFVGATLDDSLDNCDGDGYLDNTEEGLLKVTIKNAGFQNLYNTTATVASNNAHVTFPAGATINFTPTQPGETATASVAVKVAGATGVETSDFTITFQDAGTPAVAPVAAHFFEYVNADESGPVTATDTVETRQTSWAVTHEPTLLTDPSARWRRVGGSTGIDHEWFVVDPSAASDQRLTSPVMTVDGSGSVNLQFDHSWAFEFDSVNYDGGVVEMSVNGGAWTDIGGPAYNGTLTNYTGNLNPLKTRQAFVKSGNSHVSLTQAVAPGSTVQVRFRFGSDNAAGADGWRIDNIAFTGVVETPFRVLNPEADACHVTPPTPGVTIALSPEALPAATAGAPYTALVTPSGGAAPYTLNVTPVVLPAGLSSSFVADGVQISGTPEHAGTSLVKVTATDANSNLGSKTFTLTINKADSTTTVTVVNATYDGSPHGGTAAATGFGGLDQSLTVTYAGRNGTTYGPSATAPTNAGDYTAAANFPGDADHTASSDSEDFSIAKAGQTITFAAPADKTFGDAPFAVSATGGDSGNAVTFAATGNCTSGGTNGSTITITGAGSCTVTASQAGNSNYNPAADVVRTFTINKAPTTVTLGNLSHTYDGTAKAATATTSPSGLSGVTITYTLNSVPVAAPTDAGSYQVTASLSNADYQATDATDTLVIAKAGQTIDFAAPADKTFGDPDFALSAPATSGLGVSFGGTGNCTVSGSTVHITGAGTCTITASQAGDSNYNPAANVQQSFDIGKAGSTTTVTASDATYDGSPHGGTAAATGFGGLDQSLTVTYAGRNGTTYGPSTTAPTNAGDYTAAASFPGDTDHTGSNGSSDFRILKAGQAVTFAALADRTFGDADFAVSGTAGSGLGVSFTASGQCTVSGATVHLTGAGSCTVTASQAGDNNYSAAPNVERSFQIAKGATQTALSSSINPADFGQHVTFTATVTAGAGTPAGSVTFKDGAATLGTGTLDGAGVATFTTSALAAGVHTITAEYAGGSNHLTSTGTLVAGQTVKGAPTVSVGDVTVTEGDGGTKDAVFTVSLSAASGLGVSVNFATSNGTATAPGDYEAANGTLSFAPGETIKTVTVKVKGDSQSESDETFTLSLSGHVNAVLGALGTGTITDDDAAGGVLRFSAAEYSVAEGAGSVVITVERVGDTSAAASVDYATDDGGVPAVFVPCSATAGAALAHCDFTSAAGRLDFAPGESSKSFVVLVSDDTYAEGLETLRLVLRNTTGGAVLGTPAPATLTVTDDDLVTSGNALDSAAAFVRQHYHDFLNREPDTAGLQFWTREITSCGSNPACVESKRVNVSGAFFHSIEFQNTGYLVYRANVAAFGPTRVGGAVPVTSDEFLPDVREMGQGVIVGAAGWEARLEANKQEYFSEFVGRPAFTAAFPSSLTPEEFVDALNANAGGSLSQAERDALVAELTANNDDGGRASVLRKVADDADLKAAHFNRAFVLMQYFGYLRRNPNAAPDTNFDGYNFWLGKLNEFNGNYITAEMVKAFIDSIEYRQRFGR